MLFRLSIVRTNTLRDADENGDFRFHKWSHRFEKRSVFSVHRSKRGVRFGGTTASKV